MNVFYGAPNLGEKQMLNMTALNFLNNPETNNVVVYVTYSKKEANKMSELIASKNIKNKFVIFSLSENPSDSEYYYLPRIAINFINQLIAENTSSQSKEKLSIWFLVTFSKSS